METNEILTYVRAQIAAGIPVGDIRLEVLGRKGMFTAQMRSIGELPEGERAGAGAQLQKVRAEIEALLEAGETPTATTFSVDASVPALPMQFGTIHPISAMIEEMVSIFERLSFEVVEGPELVTDAENFEYLNMGPEHPARDGHDSFYVSDSYLMRTQTTAVQVVEAKKRMANDEMPIRIVVPGKTYRRESDQTHSPMFHQFDAVVIDTHSTFADLKGTLQYFTEQLFGSSVETRFRPHHFPFTEPSAELDIRFKGTSVTQGKHTGWLEMGGCGMIHPEVLKRAGINPKIYQGWAFGMSVERPVMVRYGIPDLRRLYEGGTNLLDQLSVV